MKPKLTKLSFIFHTGWKPDPVEKFTVTQSNPNSPYVVLNWSPPINMDTEYIKGYDIRLKTKANSYSHDYSDFIMDRVDNMTTTLELTTPVVTPLTTYAFEVRAYTDSSQGEWCRETKHIGIYHTCSDTTDKSGHACILRDFSVGKCMCMPWQVNVKELTYKTCIYNVMYSLLRHIGHIGL